MSCKTDPQYITNLTCYIKAVRGKQGLINLIFDIQNMPKTDYWLRTRLFYQNSAGRFLPYLVDMEMNVCAIQAELQSNIPSIKALVVKFIGQAMQLNLFNSSCPLTEGARIENLNFEDIKQNFFPPVIPEGRFLWYWRSYIKRTNHTVMEVKTHIQIRSTGITQLSMLNMG